MATLERLAASGDLVHIDIDLEGNLQPWRSIYGTRGFITWLQHALHDLETSVVGGDTTPAEQVDALLNLYVCGDGLNQGRQFRQLRPGRNGVWELKTVDVRIFGWFARRDCFVATFGDQADRVKDRGLYAGYRNETVRIRSAFGLVEFVTGGQADDVISIRD